VLEKIGSPSQTKGILRTGDTGKMIDSEWLTQTLSNIMSRLRRLPASPVS